MATIYADILSGGTQVEEAGRTVATSRLYLIGSTGANMGQVFYNALNHPLLPKCGDPLSDEDPDMILESRSCKLVDKEADGTSIVEVTCSYGLQEPEGMSPSIRLDATVGQIETQKDRDGNTIIVSYNEDTQIATITPMEVEATLSGRITRQEASPIAYIKQYLNKINDAPFAGGGEGTWLCTRIGVEELDSTAIPKKYAFDFEFQYNPATWAYTVAYKDSDGNIPSSVPPAMIDIDWHWLATFPAEFNLT